MTLEIFHVEDVMKILDKSRSTVYRMIKESRQGLNDFPIPRSMKHRRIFWSAESITVWINGQQVTPPVNAAPPTVNPAKQMRQEEKEFTQRMSAAKATLERHAAGRHSVNRKPKVKTQIK